VNAPASNREGAPRAAGHAAVEFARRVGGHPRVLPLTALLLRARCVRQSGRFVARELARSKTEHLYRLRQNGLRVSIRHGTGDIVTLGELFHETFYVPDAEIDRQLGNVSRIVDLGANIGLFGAFAAARWPGARIDAYEPDPGNADVHERTIAANHLGERWRLVRAAAGNQDGTASFAAGAAALSHLVDEDKKGSDVLTVAVRDVLDDLAEADLVKMDIEGGEWAILGDDRFLERPPRVIVLEYHPRLCPSPDPRRAVEERLEQAGLTLRSLWHRADGHGMLWAWRR